MLVAIKKCEFFIRKTNFINRVYEVYTYGSQISNFAKPAFDWFKKNLHAVSRGRIHVTNFKILEH